MSASSAPQGRVSFATRNHLSPSSCARSSFCDDDEEVRVESKIDWCWLTDLRRARDAGCRRHSTCSVSQSPFDPHLLRTLVKPPNPDPGHIWGGMPSDMQGLQTIVVANPNLDVRPRSAPCGSVRGLSLFSSRRAAPQCKCGSASSHRVHKNGQPLMLTRQRLRRAREQESQEQEKLEAPTPRRSDPLRRVSDPLSAYSLSPGPPRSPLPGSLASWPAAASAATSAAAPGYIVSTSRWVGSPPAQGFRGNWRTWQEVSWDSSMLVWDEVSLPSLLFLLSLLRQRGGGVVSYSQSWRPCGSSFPLPRSRSVTSSLSPGAYLR